MSVTRCSTHFFVLYRVFRVPLRDLKVGKFLRYLHGAARRITSHLLGARIATQQPYICKRRSRSLSLSLRVTGSRCDGALLSVGTSARWPETDRGLYMCCGRRRERKEVETTLTHILAYTHQRRKEMAGPDVYAPTYSRIALRPTRSKQAGRKPAASPSNSFFLLPPTATTDERRRLFAKRARAFPPPKIRKSNRNSGCGRRGQNEKERERGA